MGLHNKYRPVCLDEFYGNEIIKRRLNKIFLDTSKIPHAILLTGSSGTGKTTLARIIAKSLNAEVIEKNAADDRGIEAMRDVTSSMTVLPLLKTNKVYILDEFHQVTGAAQECLLKPLEEPPNNVYFIICTTDTSKIIHTVKNRCTLYEVAPLTKQEMRELLEYVTSKEGKELIEDWVNLIIQNSDGSARRALVTLDTLFSSGNSMDVTNQINEESTMKELGYALIRRKPFKDVANILKRLNTPEESARRFLLSWLNNVLLNAKQENNRVQAATCIEHMSKDFFQSGKAGFSLACFYCVFNSE